MWMYGNIDAWIVTFSLILQNSDVGIDTSSVLIESNISLIVYDMKRAY